VNWKRPDVLIRNVVREEEEKRAKESIGYG
jgi:hypothetical protein